MWRKAFIFIIVCVCACIAACKDTRENEETGDMSVKEIRLYLGDNYYYVIELPGTLEVSTDYATYITTSDKTLGISVLSDVSRENLENNIILSGEATSLKEGVLVSQSPREGLWEIAAYIGESKALRVSTYNVDIYNIVLEGILKNTIKTVDIDELKIDSLVTVTLEALPNYDGWEMSGTAIEIGDSIQTTYIFKTGSLIVTKEVRGFEDAISNMTKRLAVTVGDNVARKIYKTENVYYVEMRDFTVAVLARDFNSSITLFGAGEESRYNIVQFLKESE